MKSIWELNVKDMISPVVRKMQIDVRRAFGAMAVHGDQLQKPIQAASDKVKEQGDIFGAIGEKISGVFSMDSLQSFAGQVYDTGTKMQTLNNVIDYTSGSSEEAAKNHAFLNGMIDKMKLPLVETTEGFSQFNAAMMGTRLAGEPARKIFEGVSTAVTGMHLPAEKAQSVFNALSQMVSKGKVSSEELRQQMGEALPGSFSLAAKAMGKTDQEFTKMMDNGEVLAEDFLPKFAKALQDNYVGAVETASQSSTAKMTDFNNKYIQLQLKLFEIMEPVVSKVLELATAVLPKVETAITAVWNAVTGSPVLQYAFDLVTAAVKGLWDIAVSVFAFFQEHEFLFYMIAGAVTAFAVAVGLLSAAITIAEIAFGALNFVMGITPLGWIIIAIGALVGLVIYASNHINEMKAAIFGFGEAFKQVLTNIGQFFVKTFEPIFTAIDEFKKGNVGNAVKAAGQLLFNLTPIGAINNARVLNDNVAERYTNGRDEEMARLLKNAPADTKAAKDKTHSPAGPTKQPGVLPLAPPSKGTPSAGSNNNSGTSGAGGKNIIINIQHLVGEVKFIGGLKENIPGFKSQLKEALLSVVNDTELSAG
ncbi:MAG TPA: tape measure protein [Chitinophagales bacterium]|nr:tape measure protein [Chitinophagales bacterium]